MVVFWHIRKFSKQRRAKCVTTTKTQLCGGGRRCYLGCCCLSMSLLLFNKTNSSYILYFTAASWNKISAYALAAEFSVNSAKTRLQFACDNNNNNKFPLFTMFFLAVFFILRCVFRATNGSYTVFLEQSTVTKRERQREREWENEREWSKETEKGCRAGDCKRI